MKRKNDYVVTSDRVRLLKHVDAIHAYLKTSYWAEGIAEKDGPQVDAGLDVLRRNTRTRTRGILPRDH